MIATHQGALARQGTAQAELAQVQANGTHLSDRACRMTSRAPSSKAGRPSCSARRYRAARKQTSRLASSSDTPSRWRPARRRCGSRATHSFLRHSHRAVRQGRNVGERFCKENWETRKAISAKRPFKLTGPKVCPHWRRVVKPTVPSVEPCDIGPTPAHVCARVPTMLRIPRAYCGRWSLQLWLACVEDAVNAASPAALPAGHSCSGP